MSEEKLYFAILKEGRDDYFVEYRPPIHGSPFATLQLTYPNRVALSLVAAAMEREGVLWFSRFPLPVMVSAFDEFGDLLNFDGVRPENHVFVLWIDENNAIEKRWNLLGNEELPAEALKLDVLLKIYADVPHKTNKQLRSATKTREKHLRVGWYIVFFWVAVAPAAFLVLEFFGPEWLATLVFVYGLSQAIVNALKLLGRWKKSPSDISKEEEERRMRQHHYHCERNPEGFMRLKLDNFRQEQREVVLREAESLKLTAGDPAERSR